jgi:hypothetical protein
MNVDFRATSFPLIDCLLIMMKYIEFVGTYLSTIQMMAFQGFTIILLSFTSNEMAPVNSNFSSALEMFS